MWTVGWDLHEYGCRASLECLIMLRFGNFESWIKSLNSLLLWTHFSQVSFWGVAGTLSCYGSGIMMGMWRWKTDIHMSSRAQNFRAEQFIEYDQCYSLQLSAILMLLIDQRPVFPKGTKNFTWFSGAGKWPKYWSGYLFFWMGWSFKTFISNSNNGKWYVLCCSHIRENSSWKTMAWKS